MKKIEIDFLDNKLVLETGKLAKQTNGSVTVQHGNTLILTTAVNNDIYFLVMFESDTILCLYSMIYFS